MVMHQEFGRVVASTFQNSSWQKTMEISVLGMTDQDVVNIIDSVIEECRIKQIQLKGIAVDAGLIPMPAQSEFLNAFVRKDVVIVVDINLDDKIVVRRK